MTKCENQGNEIHDKQDQSLSSFSKILSRKDF